MEEKLINLIKGLVDQDDYIGDDCAVVELGGEKYLFSIDNFVEGTHYSSDYFSSYDIGWKSVAVNISDIAAMAGIPLMIMIAINLSDQISDKETWIKEFYKGAQDCCSKYGGVKIIGGDLCKSQDQTSISVAIIGKAHPKGVMLRSGLKPGDKICVTGTFGDSGKFLEMPHTAPGARRGIKHLRPEPRLGEALNLWEQIDSGVLMDTSDGLAQALIELAEKNKAHIEINTDLIPMNKNIDLSLALYGGEDYELIGGFSNVPEGFLLIGEVKSIENTAEVKLYPQCEILSKNKIYSHF